MADPKAPDDLVFPWTDEGGNYVEMPLSVMRELLARANLHIVSEADRKVLDAMWAIPDGTLARALPPRNADSWVTLPQSITLALQAELARRSGT